MHSESKTGKDNCGMEAIAIRLEAIASRLEAVAIRLEAIAIRFVFAHLTVGSVSEGRCATRAVRCVRLLLSTCR